MISKGIRGATSVDDNSENSIKEATVELIEKLVEKNNLEIKNISHLIFTLTKDITKAFPARFVRIDMGWNDIPMVCLNEADVENALKMCIRVLIVINCEEDFSPQFVYLKNASALRFSK